MSDNTPSLDNALRLLAEANAEIAAVRKRENEAPPEHLDLEAVYFIWQSGRGETAGETAKALGLSPHAGPARSKRAMKILSDWIKRNVK